MVVKFILKLNGETDFRTEWRRKISRRRRSLGFSYSSRKDISWPCFLATGHSARDVYRYLSEAKIEIEAKGIAVGVRLEHLLF